MNSSSSAKGMILFSGRRGRNNQTADPLESFNYGTLLAKKNLHQEPGIRDIELMAWEAVGP